MNSQNIPKDKPLIYFAMGSSGTPEIVAKVIESFAGKPYQVIAPVKFQLAQVHGDQCTEQRTGYGLGPCTPSQQNGRPSVIHGGIGTVMTAALAGKPVVGVGMQMEQVANLGLARTARVRDTGSQIAKSISKDSSRD